MHKIHANIKSKKKKSCSTSPSWGNHFKHFGGYLPVITQTHTHTQFLHKCDHNLLKILNLIFPLLLMSLNSLDLGKYKYDLYFEQLQRILFYGLAKCM